MTHRVSVARHDRQGGARNGGVEMEHGFRSGLMAASIVAITLATSGCLGGGGGGGGSGSGGLFGGSDGGSLASSFGGGSSGDAFGAPGAATVNHPEPASLALFGGGLGFLAWRRRQGRKQRGA